MNGSTQSELDIETITHALRGDPDALARLCVHHQPQVLRMATRAATRMGIADDAREVAQEVWCRLLEDGCRRLQYFCRSRGGFGPFIRLVAWQQSLTVAVVRARRAQHQRPLERGDLITDTRAPNHAAMVEQRYLVRSILDLASNRLDDMDWILLREVYMGEGSIQELAPRLGTTRAALYKRNQRLRGKLLAAVRRLQADERALLCARRIGGDVVRIAPARPLRGQRSPRRSTTPGVGPRGVPGPMTALQPSCAA